MTRNRIRSMIPPTTMAIPIPIVIAQAVPSDVQSTAGSLWNTSEPTSDRLD